MDVDNLWVGVRLLQRDKIRIAYVMGGARQLFNIDQSAAFFFAKSRIIPVPQGGPVFRLKTDTLGKRHVVLAAIVAPVNHRNPEVDEFVQLAIERAPHAPVKAQKILQHLRAVSECLLRISRLPPERLLVDLRYLWRSAFR